MNPVLISLRMLPYLSPLCQKLGFMTVANWEINFRPNFAISNILFFGYLNVGFLHGCSCTTYEEMVSYPSPELSHISVLTANIKSPFRFMLQRLRWFLLTPCGLNIWRILVFAYKLFLFFVYYFLVVQGQLSLFSCNHFDSSIPANSVCPMLKGR